MKTNLFLARHGQTQWNKVQRFQGQLDSKLTETGKQQSEKIAQQLINKEIDLIVSSSLGRAIDTANICQQKLCIPAITLDGLNERDLGHWQGQHVDELKSHKNYNEILHQYTEFKPEGGESSIGCAERIYQTLYMLVQKHKNKNLLIIFHGEALRCLLAKLGESSTDNAYQLFNNGCLFQLTYDHHNSSFQLIP